jgi:hypothetical protein
MEATMPTRTFFVIDSSGHELVDGFVAGAGELGEELAVEEEVRAEHLGMEKLQTAWPTSSKSSS